jgi:outer membrane protein
VAPQQRFSLSDAIEFALRYNPRLRSALAASERAQGHEQTAFAPFLPQIDTLNRYVATSAALAPGAPGPTGSIAPAVIGSAYSAWQSELQLQWVLYDFGRTGGRYYQAVMRTRIAQLQLVRARQTVTYDVAAYYLLGLETMAQRTIAYDTIRRAEAILKDTQSRRAAGDAERDDVLRNEVQLSEAREALVRAEEAELAALARLNNVMGRNASLPLELIDQPLQPEFHQTLAECLEQAAAQRPETTVVRDGVAAAQFGREAARGEFLPRIAVRGSVGHVDGVNVVNGWQEGAALHIDVPLYHGGGPAGNLHAAEADIRQAIADAQAILDTMSLEVTLAHRSVTAARARVDLSQPAVQQARENLRIVRHRFRNGNATPTDIVDAETVLTRSQQRLATASIEYLGALARLAYAMGQTPGTLLTPVLPAPVKDTQEQALPTPRSVPSDR